MKKIALCFVLSACLFVAWGDDTIDIVTRQVITGSMNNGTMIGSSFGIWTPYLNGRRLSETDFYRMAGDELSARDSNSRHITAMSLFWGGLLATAAGCTLMWTTDEQGVQVYTGLGVAGVGIGCLFGSIPFGVGNTRPAPYAIRLAETFNSTH